MPQQNELRVFISSTFRDLQEEREHLVKKIFPEIRAICRQRGITFTEVDLRWGLTDEDVALGQVIRTCLEEVDKCRPYFIGITGDRYGFVPSFFDVQKDPSLIEQYPWIEDASIDEMSITEMEAQYAVLRDRAQTETSGHQSAREAQGGDQHPTSQTPGGSPPLEREGRGGGQQPPPNPPGGSPPLERGARGGEAGRGSEADGAADRDEPDHARFYFRRHRTTLEDTGTEDEERTRLEAYQHRIRQSGAVIEQFRDPLSLGELVSDYLIEIINHDFADSRPPTPLEEERARHAAFALSRRRAYIADPQHLKRLNDHVASDDPPLVVYAESGSGKSSLFAFWAEGYRRKHPEVPVIEHYVGIGASATDHYGVIRHVCMEIKDRFGREEEIPSEPAQLETALGQWLGYADHALRQNGGRMVLMLDGLNQVQGAAQSLRWIPNVISSSIRLVLSSTVEGTLVELEKRGWKRLGMQALTEAAREALVVRYLAEYRKSLNAAQINRIAGDHKCGHPLFLKTLLEELRLVGQHEALDERIDSYLEATGTEDLFQRVLERLEDDHSQHAVREVMTLLWCSRSGLDERELSEVSDLARLKIGTMVAGLDYHLVRKEGRLTFFHDYLRRAVEKRYLAEEETRRRTHGRLGAYFETVELSLRTARERLWGYAEAGDDDKLVETLGDLDVLEALNTGPGVNEVLTQWARLREAGYDPESIYREKLEDQTGEAVAKVRSTSTVAHVLGSLTIWAGAVDLLLRALSAATEGGFVAEAAGAELALGSFLQLRGDHAEALERSTNALKLFEELGDRAGVALAIGGVGNVYAGRGDYDRALASYQQQLTISEELGDRRSVAAAVASMGRVYADRGDHDLALACHARQLTISDELGDRRSAAAAVGNMGAIHAERGEHDRALEHFERWLTTSEVLGDRRSAAGAVVNMGVVYHLRGEYDQALASYEKGLTISEELGNRRGVAMCVSNAGNVYDVRGEYDRALESFQRALSISEDLEDRRGIGVAVGNMGYAHYGREEYESALRCFVRAIDEHRDIGFRHGLTNSLAGSAQLLVELAQAGDEMPDYVRRHVPALHDALSEGPLPSGPGTTNASKADPGQWKTHVLGHARAQADECVAISTELSKSDTVFRGRVLLARISAAGGDAASATAVLKAMLEGTGPAPVLEDGGHPSEAERAELHYWLWKLGVDGATDHRSEAERMYGALLAGVVNYEQQQRLNELRSAGDAP